MNTWISNLFNYNCLWKVSNRNLPHDIHESIGKTIMDIIKIFKDTQFFNENWNTIELKIMCHIIKLVDEIVLHSELKFFWGFNDDLKRKLELISTKMEFLGELENVMTYLHENFPKNYSIQRNKSQFTALKELGFIEHHIQNISFQEKYKNIISLESGKKDEELQSKIEILNSRIGELISNIFQEESNNDIESWHVWLL
jgi:hypothetical protein